MTTKMGRPRVAPENKRGEYIPITVTAAEKQSIQAAAEATRQSVSDYCRQKILRAEK